MLGVGAIPAVPGEGLIHIPRSCDWLSIREAGFNFLDFQARQYRASKYNTSRGRGFKTLIKPSPEAVKRHWAKLSETIG